MRDTAAIICQRALVEGCAAATAYRKAEVKRRAAECASVLSVALYELAVAVEAAAGAEEAKQRAKLICMIADAEACGAVVA